MSKSEENSIDSSEIEIDEVEYEMDDEIVEESGLQDKLKKLRTELKSEKMKSQEYLTGWQTERASFSNYKSNEEKARIERLSAMKSKLISDFFPVLDSFDMAFSNREAWEKVDSAWRSGIEYIHTQFMNTLKEYNLSIIDTIGDEFDPMIHEPVEHVLVENESDDNKIMKVIQKGYSSGNTVLRPAKVKVGKYEN